MKKIRRGISALLAVVGLSGLVLWQQQFSGDRAAANALPEGAQLAVAQNDADTDAASGRNEAEQADDASGDEEEGPDKKSAADPREVFRPTSVPDRIILTWTGDPARSVAVTWRTDTSIARGVAQVAPASASPDFGSARDIAAQTALLDADLGKSHYHSALLDGLKPATKYAYRVGDGAIWSEWFHITTASDKSEPFSFIYFGDAQNDLKSMWSRVIREAYSDAPKARFMLHAGDLINGAENDVQWGEWFGAGGWLNGMVPSVPTPGNHEYKGNSKDRDNHKLSKHWRPQFALPEHGPAGLEETVYHIDYQGARIISLNSNERPEAQVEWLGRALADNPNRWTIVTFHHPFYSAVKNRDNAELRTLWKPLFDKHRVDLVLQGHDHSYARSGLNVPDNVAEGAAQVSPAGGTVYVVSVSGPKMYNLHRQPLMQRAASDTQLYQIIHVGSDELRYEARTAIGELYDAFTLKKREGMTNELIEQVPDTPERLRNPRPEKVQKQPKPRPNRNPGKRKRQ
jgi:Purple acid Phosphatase, N-terminal domain/Calcineurin-like phosphoesterase